MRGFARVPKDRVPSSRATITLVAITLLLAAALAPSAAAGGSPSAGSAVVDGNPGEWSLGADHFADMSATGSTMADLYLRYDCKTNTLFALVLTRDGFKARQTRPENAYIRVDASGKLVSGLSGNDGTSPDFSWVGGDGTLAGGYEASGPLAPGTYPLRAHVLIADDSADGYTPIDANESLVIDCTVATATPTPKSTAGGGVGPTQGHATPPGGAVGGVRGTPRVTLPPTDTGNGMIPGDQSLGVRAVLIGMAALACALLVLSPKPTRRRGRSR